MLKYLKTRFDVLVWFVCVAALFWFLHPLLTDQLIAGWDLTSHFYLQAKMVELLKEGAISGYDMNWFGGYPAFTFYGPLPYILVALPYLLSFGLIPLNFFFNFFLFLLPFFFLFSIYYSSRVWFGRDAGAPSLLFALFFLLADNKFAHFGLGLNAEITLGLFASIFAISLMVLLFGVLGRQRERQSWKLILAGGVLFAMIILTHVLTTIFTGVLMIILLLSDGKKLWRPLVLTFLSALVFSSFWLIPFLLNLEFSSAQMIGVPPMSKDPLFILYPGIVLLFFSVFGLTRLFRSKNHFWAYAFVVTLIVLPRDYLVYVIDLPVHYYRFIPHIFVLNIFLAVAGLQHVLKAHSGIVLKYIALGAVLLSVAMAVLKFDMRSDYHFFFEEYEHGDDARAMLEYIDGLAPDGRVAVEIKPDNHDKLGTPHFFSTFLPLQYGIPVVPGLLAESAMSSEFILPSLVQTSDSIAWGNVSLLQDIGFRKQSRSFMIERLGLYGVEYLLIGSDYARNLLQIVADDELILQKQIGDFSLLKLADFRPLIESTTYAPFLFIDRGGMNFREFSAEWFRFPELFDYPVIYAEKSPEKMSAYEMSRVGGLIVSVPKEDHTSVEDLNALRNMTDKIVFLDASESFENQLATLLAAFAAPDSGRTEIVLEIIPEVVENERLVFFSETGTLLNYSYFPKWRSADGDQTVFWSTPSMMFVFGKGETEIFYD